VTEEESPLNDTGVADGIPEPEAQNGTFLFRGEGPGDGGFHEAAADVVQADRGADGEIEALGKPVHGNPDLEIGRFEDGFAEAVLFGPEPEGEGSVEGKLLHRDVVGAEAGGDEAETAGLQVTDAGEAVPVPGITVAVEVNPIGGPHGNLAVEGIRVAVFNDMKVLDPEALAGAHDGAGVVGLEDVLENDLDMTCPPGEDRFHAAAFFRGDELEKMLDEGILDHWVQRCRHR